jgi:hypothetical protein
MSTIVTKWGKQAFHLKAKSIKNTNYSSRYNIHFTTKDDNISPKLVFDVVRVFASYCEFNKEG